MSLREIHDATGVAKGTLSNWLRTAPLTEGEQRERQRRIRRYQAPKKDRGEPSKFYLVGEGLTYSKTEKAKIAEAAVLFRAIIHRFNVFGSPFDGDRADWIIEAEKNLYRVQVKCALGGKRGLPHVSLCHVPGGRETKRYKREDFDFIVGYVFFTDTCYVWSWDEVSHLKRTVTVCSKAAEAWHKLRG